VDSTNSIDQPTIFFDGVCNLCNGSVQIIIKNDPSKMFRYASLQSEYAKEHLPIEFTNDSNYESLVLKEGDQVFIKSTAVLNIAKGLRQPWPWLYGFIILPKFLRDWLYSLIAKNRYVLFGKKDACMIPTPELKSLFHD